MNIDPLCQRVLGLGEQLAFIKTWWPQFRSSVENGVLVSTGELQPMDISEVYTVEINQRGGKSPDVWVREPKLRTIGEGIKIPHMYLQETLCLYLPGSGEWEPDDPIAFTIIPWASLWLLYYETWHATGKWLGGGVDPEIPITYRKANRGRFNRPR